MQNDPIKFVPTYSTSKAAPPLKRPPFSDASVKSDGPPETVPSLLRISVSPIPDGALKIADEEIFGSKKHKVIGTGSPDSIAFWGSLSVEAPGRLESKSVELFPTRNRSFSNLDVDENFCKLHTFLPKILSADLPRLVNNADSGFKAGIIPTLVGDGLGGTYFLSDSAKSISVVFKPSDEEPSAPQNPRQDQLLMGKIRPSFKGGIVPGFGMFREVSAFDLDRCFSGVPPTHLAKVRHSLFNPTQKVPYKIGSVQSFVRSICTAEDMGPSMFDVEDIQRIAVLDIRLCNLDRHTGNILVCHVHPYQLRNCQTPRPKFSGDGASGFDNFPTSPPLSQMACSAPSKYQSFLKDESMESMETSSSVPGDENCPPLSQSHTTRRYRLVPIDHGYCLPHVLHMHEATLCWTDWKEADAPLSEELRAHIAALDADEDAAQLRRLVGAAISEECLLTLWVCTKLLQLGVQAGMTLGAIGRLITSDINELSPLQVGVMEAVQRAVVVSRELKLSAWHRGDSSRDGRNGLIGAFHRSQTVSDMANVTQVADTVSPIVDEEKMMVPLSSLLGSISGRILLEEELTRTLRSLVGEDGKKKN